MGSTSISSKTTDAILKLLRTLPFSELEIIVKKIMPYIVSNQRHTKRKSYSKKNESFKIEHIEMKFYGKTFDRNYLYENTR